jgi:hypothetical protein
VTARLSKRFYDRFGDDIANEFVNWFNDVDATYRASLIQLNDTNFVRFDAKLEQRLAEQDARIEKRFAEFRSGMLTWMVGLWLTSMLAVTGMFVTLLRMR